METPKWLAAIVAILTTFGVWKAMELIKGVVMWFREYHKIKAEQDLAVVSTGKVQRDMNIQSFKPQILLVMGNHEGFSLSDVQIALRKQLDELNFKSEQEEISFLWACIDELQKEKRIIMLKEEKPNGLS